MRYSKWTAAAAVIGLGLAFGAASANAGSADSMSCMRAGKEVSAALDSNKTSSNYEAAMAERNQGLRACHGGFYRMGLARYAAAMKLLGVEKSS